MLNGWYLDSLCFFKEALIFLKIKIYEGVFENYTPLLTQVWFMAIKQPLMRPNKRLADPRTPQIPITKHFNDRYDRGKLIFSKQT